MASHAVLQHRQLVAPPARPPARPVGHRAGRRSLRPPGLHSAQCPACWFKERQQLIEHLPTGAQLACFGAKKQRTMPGHRAIPPHTTALPARRPPPPRWTPPHCLTRALASAAALSELRCHRLSGGSRPLGRQLLPVQSMRLLKACIGHQHQPRVPASAPLPPVPPCGEPTRLPAACVHARRLRSCGGLHFHSGWHFHSAWRGSIA